MPTERLTRADEDAIVTALHIVLASPVIDGFDEDSDEEMEMRRRMLSAKTKLNRREEARQHRAVGS